MERERNKVIERKRNKVIERQKKERKHVVGSEWWYQR